MGNQPRAERNGRFIDFEGARLYFESIGAGEPVLLLHGGTGNVEEMDVIADKLSAHYWVISANLRGHGRSECPLSTISYRQFARDSLAIIRAVTEKPVAVIGFSDGGNAALLMAATAPQHVAKVIAIGANISRAGLRPQMNDWQDDPQAHDFYTTMYRLWRTETIVPPEVMQTITVPCLILGGDRDECINPQHFVDMYELLPAGYLAIVADANHCDSAFRAEVIDSIMLPFLRR